MNTKTFNPIGEFNDIVELERFKDFLMDAKDKKKINSDINVLSEEIEEKKEELKRKYQEILDYISQYWGKFIHMKFFYNTNYTETRESNPEWTVYYEANVMPYAYNPSNNCLFGLFNKLNDMYRGGIEDKSIVLFDLVQKDVLEITEITEEEFLDAANQSVFDCLKARCDKIESGEYELTKNGYKKNDKISFNIHNVLI